MTIDRYLENRRFWETLLVFVVVLIGFFASLGEVWLEYGRSGHEFPVSEPLILEITSHLALLAVFPLFLLFDRRFPLRVSTLRRSIPAHIAGSVVFSYLHVQLMYWARQLAFHLAGRPEPYVWENWATQFLYEYTKDVRTYMVILALVYLYGFVIRRLQGEAGFVDETTADEAPAPSDRFLVKKLGREFLVKMNEIDWIESCGNYVNLHVGGKVYPLRDTMTAISERLVAHGFMRVHRTAIVNLDRVSEIVPFDTGDGQVRLSDETLVPVSRRFRKTLREKLG